MGRPSVDFSRTVGTQLCRFLQGKQINNPQRGNWLKLSTDHIKKKKKKESLELQLDRKLLELLANLHFEQSSTGNAKSGNRSKLD